MFTGLQGLKIMYTILFIGEVCRKKKIVILIKTNR